MFAPEQKMRSLALVIDDARGPRVLEADALDRVGELDVDAEVVRVELERVAGDESAVLSHVEREARHVAVERELPVP